LIDSVLIRPESMRRRRRRWSVSSLEFWDEIIDDNQELDRR
jgi:hypothetical protein